MANPGGRQDVSGDELRLLAARADEASCNVARLRQRVQDIVGGIDRRGWQAGPFDDQWARTRFGLSQASDRVASAHTELIARSAEADRLNTPMYHPPLELAGNQPAAAADTTAASWSTTSLAETQPPIVQELAVAVDAAVERLLDNLSPAQRAQFEAVFGADGLRALMRLLVIAELSSALGVGATTPAYLLAARPWLDAQLGSLRDQLGATLGPPLTVLAEFVGVLGLIARNNNLQNDVNLIEIAGMASSFISNEVGPGVATSFVNGMLDNLAPTDLERQAFGRRLLNGQLVADDAGPSHVANSAAALYRHIYHDDQSAENREIKVYQTGLSADGAPEYMVLVAGTDPTSLTGYNNALLGAASQGSGDLDSLYYRQVFAIINGLPAGAGSGTRHVQLVGHSLGGMVARRLASSTELNPSVTIDSITTFGSPYQFSDPERPGIRYQNFVEDEDPVAGMGRWLPVALGGVLATRASDIAFHARPPSGGIGYMADAGGAHGSYADATTTNSRPPQFNIDPAYLDISADQWVVGEQGQAFYYHVQTLDNLSMDDILTISDGRAGR